MRMHSNAEWQGRQVLPDDEWRTANGEGTLAATPQWGDHLTTLDTPTVVVDLDRMEDNIVRIASLAADQGLLLRPHVKTHKSVAIGRLQLDAGADGLSFAKLDELAAFSSLEAQSFLVAYPIVTPLKARRTAELQRLIRSRLQVGVDSFAGARVLSEAATMSGQRMNVLLEVDCGLGRCGVAPTEAGNLAVVVDQLPNITVDGVFTHGGHAYKSSSEAQLRRSAEDEVEAVIAAVRQIQRVGVSVDTVSIGSTPTFMQPVDRRGVTEVRPGNYVFFDRTQVSLGVATEEQCALSVLCTVVSIHGDRAIIDAGSKVFGLDRGAHGVASLDGYGVDQERGFVLSWLSEEHGVIEDGSGLDVGDRLRIVPNHACSTANLAEQLVMVRGERVESCASVDARGGGR